MLQSKIEKPDQTGDVVSDINKISHNYFPRRSIEMWGAFEISRYL